MKTILGINGIKKLARPVVALGIFDGVHRGHRRILQAAVKKAGEIKGKSVVVTFFPHPRGQESLNSLQHRLRLIRNLNIDTCILISFTENFSRMSAEDFIAKVLVDKIGVNFIYVGQNFRFGWRARGDLGLLKEKAKIFHYRVKVFPVLKSGRYSISSTLIRQLIKNYKIKAAQNLLGRPVSVLGTVIRGNRLGRLLGFPTANIMAHHEVVPPPGIYAVRVIFLKKKLDGVCYIGNRSTVSAQNKSLSIEVHILDFHRDIYGKILEIQFVKLIRPDRKFPSLAALAEQIQKDVASCKKIL